MADSAFKTQISKDENANSASNVIYVQPSDGAGNVVTVTGGKLDVNATVSVENIFVDDSAFVVGTDNVGATGFLADQTATDSVDEGDIGIARMTLDRRVITASQQDGTWTVELGATDNAVLDAIAASLVDIETNTDFGAVVGGGTEATALRVTIANDSTGVLSIDDNGGSITVDGTVATTPSNSPEGTAVHDYKTATPGAGASDNHDYTVTGTTFYLKSVAWGGSGKEKCEVKVGPVASLVTKYVGFSEKDTAEQVFFEPPIPVPVASTGTVRVTITNRQGAAVDVYSTIIGDDV